MDIAEMELQAVRSRFRSFVDDLDLADTEVAALLNLGPVELGPDLMPWTLGPAAEHRMRLIIEIHHLLSWALPSSSSTAEWCRSPVGEDSDGSQSFTPLGYLCGPLPDLRLLRDMLQSRSGLGSMDAVLPDVREGRL